MKTGQWQMLRLLNMNNLIINMMVKNEIRYIKQTLASTLPFIENAIIIDTGSTDGTREYLRKIATKNTKVHYQEININKDSTVWNGNHISQPLTNVRNTMLARSKELGFGWVLQVDGDEIYTKQAMDSLIENINKLHLPGYERAAGIMVPIKWCVSDTHYVAPGPFDKTFRVMRSDGIWLGKFPDEFLYINGIPVTINDRRCITSQHPFLHMSMALHPERRSTNGAQIYQLNDDEIKKIEPLGEV